MANDNVSMVQELGYRLKVLQKEKRLTPQEFLYCNGTETFQPDGKICQSGYWLSRERILIGFNSEMGVMWDHLYVVTGKHARVDIRSKPVPYMHRTRSLIPVAGPVVVDAKLVSFGTGDTGPWWEQVRAFRDEYHERWVEVVNQRKAAEKEKQEEARRLREKELDEARRALKSLTSTSR